MKKTYPKNSDRRNYFTGMNYDADIEFRRYRGLIKKILPDLYTVFEKNLRLDATLYDVAGNVYKAHNTGPFSAIRCYESLKTAWLITWVESLSVFFFLNRQNQDLSNVRILNGR